MRIGFVTQWFPPEPALVAEQIAHGLVGRGHHVDVVTGFPNYPSGTLYPGYRVRAYQQESPEPGLVVHRAPLWPNHDASAAKRMGNYLSFAAGSSWVVRRHVPAPDAWLVYSSPATAILPTARLLSTHRRPVFLLIQDLWPDSVTGSGFVPGRTNRAIEAALTRFCDWSYEAAAGIGVISPGMRDVLVARGVNPEKIHDTPNWVDDAHVLPRPAEKARLRAELGLPETRTWLYAGNVGNLQGLDSLVDVFAQVPEATLAIVGDGVARARLQDLVSRRGITNVRLLPPVTPERIGDYIAAADIQVVALQDTPLLRVTMPSKVQTCLAAGSPVLAYAAGDVADLVTGTGCGWSATPGDEAASIRAVRAGLTASDAELAQCGLAARRRYESDFSPTVGPARLEAALVKALE